MPPSNDTSPAVSETASCAHSVKVRHNGPWVVKGVMHIRDITYTCADCGQDVTPR